MKSKSEIKAFKKSVETYIKLIDKIATEDFLSLGIVSMSLMNEVLNTKDPIDPRMIVKYISGTEETIDGFENINKKLKELLCKALGLDINEVHINSKIFEDIRRPDELFVKLYLSTSKNKT
jgi:hypothetical protein